MANMDGGNSPKNKAVLLAAAAGSLVLTVGATAWATLKGPSENVQGLKPTDPGAAITPPTQDGSKIKLRTIAVASDNVRNSATVAKQSYKE